MRKRKIISFILIMFLVVSFTACQKDVDEDQGTPNDNGKDNENQVQYKPEFGGTMVVPISHVDTLNPLLDNSLSQYYFNKLIFEGLFEFDESLDINPALAESYEIKDNGRKISVKLKDNVLWHDGEKFNAEDVKFTINVMKYAATDSIYSQLMTEIYKPGNPGDLQHILSVNVIDEYNLEIAFDRSYSNSLESLIFPIIPKHLFAGDSRNLEEAYQLALTKEGYNPIGTGPYKFDSYDELKLITLKSNEDWWNGKTYIEEIQGKILEDRDLAITSFESNIVDIALAINVDWEKYAQNGDINIYDFISQKYSFLGFNFKNEVFQGEKGKALRQAIAYGIDRDYIIEHVYLGHGTKVDVPIHPDSWLLSEKDSSTYKYNVNKAREKIESAGWKDSNEDGIYEDESGSNLRLRLLTNSYNELRRQTANSIAEYLEDIGIVVVKDYNSNRKDEITEDMAENQWNEVVGKISSGDFDMTLLEWELSYIPDLAFAFHSSEIEEGTNIIGYEDETMDNLISNAFKAGTREDKNNAYKELQNYLIEELPYVSLYFDNSALLVNNKIKGDINPKSFNIYYNIQDWFIEGEPITEE
ncbi:peptide ABC transporter substrate-binding protein [Sporosalibacterium faouarense]|uniref:peptide ABC transporter substrate-binding protein n=1 Tax=Sporosalibacterium faouarense TaxID=516123 RepID=UPI00141D06C9|nr:peptide ABC transporter substrate-binding protein [Sporosalibacterium faouarense]MTI48563.1 peptide ABC transporter substrate-binding protein [Bacillota bacterium]